MKYFLLALFVISLSITPAQAGQRLVDVSYSFDSKKLQSAKDTFHFLRTFVDYYYLIAKANKDNLNTLAQVWNNFGWCVGDAHPENFGTLLLNSGPPIFTMNDMDDAGPCPLVLDVFRLMLSSHIYDNDTSGKKILAAYVEGLKGHSYPTPSSVLAMLQKSKKQGMPVSDKDLNGNKLVRLPNSRELSSQEQNQVQQALVPFVNSMGSGAKIIDTYATVKTSGGSFGLLRYEVLISAVAGLIHVELKEEVRPSIYPVATAPIPNQAARIAATIRAEMGPNASKLYGVVTVGSKTMLVRPKFNGDNGVSLDDEPDYKNITQYEGYTLGRIHARTLGGRASQLAKNIEAISEDDWAEDVDQMAKFFRAKFSTVH